MKSEFIVILKVPITY